MRSKSKELMKKIQQYAEQFCISNLRTPSTGEIAQALKVSKATVHNYLKAMDEQGMLSYQGGELRTRVTQQINMEQVGIPIAGAIPCGTPEEEVENIEEYIALVVPEQVDVDDCIRHLEKRFSRRQIFKRSGRAVSHRTAEAVVLLLVVRIDLVVRAVHEIEFAVHFIAFRSPEIPLAPGGLICPVAVAEVFPVDHVVALPDEEAVRNAARRCVQIVVPVGSPEDERIADLLDIQRIAIGILCHFYPPLTCL